MSKLQAIIPTIFVIFPRSLALLSADATGELFVVTIMWTYNPIMERQGRNILKKILNTSWNLREKEPDKTNLNTQTSLEGELFGSKLASAIPVQLRINDQIQQKTMYPVSLFPLKAIWYLEGFTTATHRSIANSNVM